MRARALRLAFAVALVAPSLAGCSKAPTVKAVEARKLPVETTVTTTSSGTVEAEQQAVLGFSAAGRVGRVNVQTGARVRRGQVLAELENSDLATIHRDAQAELGRAKSLFEAGLVARVALDEARKAAEIARANLDKSIIRAPFDGVVTEVNLEVGELSQSIAAQSSGGSSAAAASLAPIRLIDLKPRLVKGNIDEIDLPKVKAGMRARVKINAVRAEPFEARVTRTVPFISTIKEQDRTSQVELRLEGAAELVPVGASADIEIIVDSRADALAVPTRALVGRGADRVVFRAAGGKAERAPVKVGVGNYDRTEIREGIRAGDTILFPPDDFELKDGAKIQVEKVSWP